MNQVRIQGDPFGEGAAASRLRSFLRLALACRMRCSLSVADARRRSEPARLPPAELDALVRAAGECVAATAPVVVFAPAAQAPDSLLLAGLEWPLATAVFVARDTDTAAELLDRVRAELRWAGADDPPHALDERELAPWLALPADAGGGVIVHVGSADPADGTDLVIDACAQGAANGAPLRLVLPEAGDATVAAIRARLAGHGASCEIVRATFVPQHVHDAAAIVLPWRAVRSTRALVQALASGRAVCVSRFAATAGIVGRHGTCLPIGGRVTEAGFTPDARAVAAAMKQAYDAVVAAATGQRARQHVKEHFVRGAPSAPPAPCAAPRPGRPSAVLEAPFLARSPDAVPAIATARALLRAGNVDLRLVPTAPIGADLAALRRRAPELVPLLSRAPGRPDLWLSWGSPLRVARPDCGTWALRVDAEDGHLPIDATPHVTQEADLVIVSSEPGCRTLLAAGRSMASLRVVPHGVDEVMHAAAAQAIEREAFAAMHARRTPARRAATERTVALPAKAPTTLRPEPVPVPS